MSNRGDLRVDWGVEEMNSLEVLEEVVKRHTVKCELHELHYNPTEQTGCVLCVREERRAEASRRRLLVLVGVLGVAFLAAAVHQATRSGAEGSNLLASVGGGDAIGPGEIGSVASKLDAEAYRPEIDRLEAILYQTTPLTLDNVDQAAGAARGLADRIQARETPQRGGAAVMRILTWASSALEDEVGSPLADLSQARSGWEEVRSQTFEPVPWFGVAAVPEAAQSSPSAEVSRSVVASLQTVSNDIFHLIRVGRLESDAIGEIVSDAKDDPAVLETRRKWNEWRREWASQVQRAAKRMPPPPSMSSNINLLLAYQKTIAALNDLSLVPVSGGDEPVPYLYQRRSRFETAEREAAEAETRLKALD